MLEMGRRESNCCKVSARKQMLQCHWPRTRILPHTPPPATRTSLPPRNVDCNLIPPIPAPQRYAQLSASNPFGGLGVAVVGTPTSPAPFVPRERETVWVTPKETVWVPPMTPPRQTAHGYVTPTLTPDPHTARPRGASYSDISDSSNYAPSTVHYPSPGYRSDYASPGYRSDYARTEPPYNGFEESTYNPSAGFQSEDGASTSGCSSTCACGYFRCNDCQFQRCQGITNRGEQCSRINKSVWRDGGWCYQHKNQAQF
jgi:hypothetical protein